MQPPFDTLPPDHVQTLPELFSWRAAQTPEALAYRECAPDSGRWSTLSWRVVRARVDRLAQALAAQGLVRGDRVALLLRNGVNAVCFDQAVLALGCVPVPMHALDNPQSIAYILGDADARMLVVETAEQWAGIAAQGAELPALRHVVTLAPTPADAFAVVPVLGLDALLSCVPVVRLASPQLQLGAHDLAALVYTSGTTGRPKGVMLTHANVLSNVRATARRFQLSPGDVFLSFLPLSHTFERTCGYYLPMAAGASVAFARSVSTLMADLEAVRPTVLVSVPRIYERVHARLLESLGNSPLRRRIFDCAQAVGWGRFCRRQGLAAPAPICAAPLEALAWPLLDVAVGRTLRSVFGGRLRAAVSGGAPLALPIARCFLGLGVQVLQGYGMTETSPVVAANALDDNDPSTVGRLVDGVECRVTAQRELQVRGPGVMRGYWKRDADTARAFDDGWLRTGDLAEMVDGRLRILGRLKEIIVTSTGEKIAPADVELAVTVDPLFEQAYVFGDDRPFIACVAVLARAAWEGLASPLGLDPAAPQSLEDPAAREAALARLREATRSFPYYAQPRAVLLTLEPWTVENSLMTPTLKLKRHNLAARFARSIDQLYTRPR